MSILLSVLLLCSVAAAELPAGEEIGSITVNGSYTISCVKPEGYEMQILQEDSTRILGTLTADEDGNRPILAFSIVYEETYSEIDRMNDLSEEDLAFLEGTYAEENPTITYRETAYGTKLMCVSGTVGTSDFLSILTIYRGYMIEFDVFPGQETEGKLTEEQIQMAVDCLSEMTFTQIR